MSMVNPIKQTTNREEIETKLDSLYNREGEINREFTDKPTIYDLIYDELRNLNGALASLSAGNEIYLKAIVDNTATTADRLGDSNMSKKSKRVKLKSNERHTIYKALGSRASTLRNQIGYTRVNEDGTLRSQITECENIIRKLKNS